MTVENINVLTDAHNQSVHKALEAIVAPTIASGGSSTDVLVVLESVVWGVVMAMLKLDKRLNSLDAILFVLTEGVSNRQKRHQALLHAKHQGEA